MNKRYKSAAAGLSFLTPGLGHVEEIWDAHGLVEWTMVGISSILCLVE